MMKKAITIQDMRQAIMYVNNGHASQTINLEDVSDEQLLDYDFTRDLNMGNIKLINVITELQKHHGLHLPQELSKIVPDNRVKSLLDTINLYLKDASALGLA